jgi:hypothetical protein
MGRLRQGKKRVSFSAAKLVGTLQVQDQPPAPLGFGRLSAMPMHHPFAEPQLGILWIELQPLLARAPGLLRVPRHLMDAGN